MKSFATAALLASAQAIHFQPDDQIDLQIGVEANARSFVREQLITNLRNFLEQDQEISDNQNVQLSSSKGAQWPPEPYFKTIKVNGKTIKWPGYGTDPNLLSNPEMIPEAYPESQMVMLKDEELTVA